MRMREGATAPRAGRLGLKLPAAIARQRVHEARFYGLEIGRYFKAQQTQSRGAGGHHVAVVPSAPANIITDWRAPGP